MITTFPSFQIIQGGMGVGVSGWQLAQAVSKEGQLGVVSGTALDLVLARQLQLGDQGGHLRKALETFPIPGAAKRILDRYFIEGGKEPEAPFRPVPMPSVEPSQMGTELTLAGSYAFIRAAKEEHDNPVGINLLTKIQLPTLLVLFGAMLASVDVVIMGAGIPGHIPAILDKLVEGKAAAMAVEGGRAEDMLSFDPISVCSPDVIARLQRPRFLAIVSSQTLAKHLVRKAGGIDGFVVEGSTAGGHNAPPRGAAKLNAAGEPIYSARDAADLAAFRGFGLPFWLAGGYGRPGGLEAAQAEGAAGIQVGTLFAFCKESGLDPAIKQSVLASLKDSPTQVFTDPTASPTGFPFKVVQLEGSVAEPAVYEQRERVCDLGHLREASEGKKGGLDFRCPAEPIQSFIDKGGDPAQSKGRVCLCNGLMAAIGLGQVRKDAGAEPPLVTAGDDLVNLGSYFKETDNYRAKDVLRLLLS